MNIVILLVVGVGLVAVLLYAVREAAVLKSTAVALKSELEEFKTRGFDQLIRDKVDSLEQAARRQVEERERLIKQKDEELSKQQQQMSKSRDAQSRC